MRRSAPVRVTAISLLAIGCMILLPFAGRAQADANDTWTTLRRPLQVPTLAPGTACPALPPRPIAAELGAPLTAEPVLGTFPLFAKGNLTFASTEQRFSKAPSDHEGWVRYKTIWYGHPVYAGPILVRGVQLDGDGSVRFDGMGASDGHELRLSTENAGSDGSGAGWRTWNTQIGVQQPGCYAWQIDGETFTTIVVFTIQP